jgi:hypothetical protein
MGTLETPSLSYTLAPAITPVLNYTLSPSLTLPPLLPPLLTPSVLLSPSLTVNQQNVYTAINRSNLTYEQKITATSFYITFIIVFFLDYSSLVSGIGAILYGVGSLTQIDVPTMITNNTGRMLVNFVIFLCGIITVLEWLALETLIFNISYIYNKTT